MIFFSDPMRITKKFAGSSCIGKQIVNGSDGIIDEYKRKEMQDELISLEKKFMQKIDYQQNAISSAPHASFKNENKSYKSTNATDVPKVQKVKYEKNEEKRHEKQEAPRHYRVSSSTQSESSSTDSSATERTDNKQMSVFNLEQIIDQDFELPCRSVTPNLANAMRNAYADNQSSISGLVPKNTQQVWFVFSFLISLF